MQSKAYSIPDNIDPDQLYAQAHRRRDALEKAGCSTYTIGYKGGIQEICCLCCGLGSVNPGDVVNRYCGFCKCFHSEWDIPNANES